MAKIFVEVVLGPGQLSDLERSIAEQGWQGKEFPTWFDTKSNGDIVWHFELEYVGDE